MIICVVSGLWGFVIYFVSFNFLFVVFFLKGLLLRDGVSFGKSDNWLGGMIGFGWCVLLFCMSFNGLGFGLRFV